MGDAQERQGDDKNGLLPVVGLVSADCRGPNSNDPSACFVPTLTLHRKGFQSTSLIVQSIVMFAVFANIAVAEQYLSCDNLIARSTKLAFNPLPMTRKCMFNDVKTLGSDVARSA